MYRFKDVKIREFTYDDIPLKIEWVNNKENNKYLHYDLPLEYEKTCQWFKKNKDNSSRFDAVIEYLGEPVGLTGLLAIDYKNLKAEEYMLIGNTAYKGKGIAKKAGILNQIYGFYCLNLNKIVAFTEIENLGALSLYLKRGFSIEGILRNDLIMNKVRKVDRYALGLRKDEYVMSDYVYWEE